jgi:von Willebrand factor type A domain
MRLVIFFLFGLTMSYPVSAETDRSVALILDASGSMQAKLSNGDRRINAAKDAVENFAKSTVDSIRLSLWAYGHQSPRSKKDCADIQQLTDYELLGNNRANVISHARGLTAQGYTPISDILERAANDLKSETQATSRIVVLVSDGKETCKGDPCAVAKALAEADANLVVHTIGFAVDVAARYELQCIAKHARGNYYEASDVGKLSENLAAAVSPVVVEPPKPVKEASPKPGSLALSRSSSSRHLVINSATGEEVGHLSAVTPAISLPEGIYSVQFGNAFWRGIEIENGETTEINTAILSVPNASYRGHEIRDWETGEEIAKLSSARKSMNLMPSTFLVMFGTMAAKVELKPGVETEVAAGSVVFKGLPINSRSIYNVAGEEVQTVSATGSAATLLAGEYELEHDEKRYAFTIEKNTVVTVQIE